MPFCQQNLNTYAILTCIKLQPHRNYSQRKAGKLNNTSLIFETELMYVEISMTRTISEPESSIFPLFYQTKS
jgi:hypothetical protein